MWDAGLWANEVEAKKSLGTTDRDIKLPFHKLACFTVLQY